jgi:hypothetical protein
MLIAINMDSGQALRWDYFNGGVFTKIQEKLACFV